MYECRPQKICIPELMIERPIIGSASKRERNTQPFFTTAQAGRCEVILTANYPQSLRESKKTHVEDPGAERHGE